MSEHEENPAMFTDAIERATTYALGEKILKAIQDNDERHIEDVIAERREAVAALQKSFELEPPGLITRRRSR
jgi:hypothetical protein